MIYIFGDLTGNSLKDVRRTNNDMGVKSGVGLLTL